MESISILEMMFEMAIKVSFNNQIFIPLSIMNCIPMLKWIWPFPSQSVVGREEAGSQGSEDEPGGHLDISLHQNF